MVSERKQLLVTPGVRTFGRWLRWLLPHFARTASLGSAGGLACGNPSRRGPMGTDGNRWEPMGTDGNRWEPMGIGLQLQRWHWSPMPETF